MLLQYNKEEIAFRKEVRAFFHTAMPSDMKRRVELGQCPTKADLVNWQRILDAKGWAVPSWPVEWGGTGWTAVQHYIYNEEMLMAPALSPLPHINQVGVVILAVGTPEQKQHFLPRIRTLDYWFCQGFSEPGSGSDLASLRTRAERVGDHYIVNGQKLWTSYAQHADWMYALVRTDAGAKKQQGISYLLIDMKSPGITIRPVITIDGEHRTNEVYFDNVRVPVENRLGEENRGWGYAKHTLGHERLIIARVGMSKGLVRRAKELAAGVPQDGATLADNARFREKLAAIEVELKALEITNMRVVSEFMKQEGHRQDPKSSVLKLKGSELRQQAHETLLEVAGPHAMALQREFLHGDDVATLGPEWAGTLGAHYFFIRHASIAGGSSEIQHNIIAKGVLGL